MPNPFGLKFGSTPSSGIAEYSISFHSVPNPHPLLKVYDAIWTPEAGIIEISGRTNVFENDRHGALSRSAYDTLKRQLQSVYGRCHVIEEIAAGAYYNEEYEFAASLRARERFHFTVWSEEAGATLDSGISEITLSLWARSDDDTIVNVSYNYEKKRLFDSGSVGADTL